MEILRQKTCIEKIVERHRYEVLHLFEDLEKLKLADAEKDDKGMDTIEDLGERFKLDKVWKGPGIDDCMRNLNTILQKIELTEGLTRSNLNSQRCVLESLSIKWGNEYLTFRDSWIENSDYERSKKVMNDMVMWVSNQRDKLGRREAELTNYRCVSLDRLFTSFALFLFTFYLHSVNRFASRLSLFLFLFTGKNYSRR